MKLTNEDYFALIRAQIGLLESCAVPGRIDFNDCELLEKSASRILDLLKEMKEHKAAL